MTSEKPLGYGLTECKKTLSVLRLTLLCMIKAESLHLWTESHIKSPTSSGRPLYNNVYFVYRMLESRAPRPTNI